MLDTVHYVSGGAAAGSLRALCASRPTHDVVEVLDPLSIGPLLDVDRPGGIGERRRYLRRMFERIGETALFEGLTARIGLPELRAARPDAARAMVWCGPNADEQIMLRAACAWWRRRPLYVVDVGASVHGGVASPAVGACTLGELPVAEQAARVVPDHERLALAADWERLLRSDHKLRRFENGQIVGRDERLFDPLLLAACPIEFASAARVVGQVMSEAPELIGDSFLDYRLRELMARGEIEADDAAARLPSMRIRRQAPAGSTAQAADEADDARRAVGGPATPSTRGKA